MKKVLIVDDSALMRRVLSDIINDDEQLIVEKTANNGLEALNVLQGGCRPDILLLPLTSCPALTYNRSYDSGCGC